MSDQDLSAGCIQVTTTCDNRAALEKIAAQLVEKRLAACVQIAGPIKSVYRWQGKVEAADEWMCIIKSAADRTRRLIDEISELHPYDVPEIIVSPIVDGGASYLKWIIEQTRLTS